MKSPKPALPISQMLDSASRPSFKAYPSAKDVPYSAEGAFAEGKKMANEIEACSSRLRINKIRKVKLEKSVDWLYDKELPQTTIALIGATGAGKSSILNSLLGEQILPTSGLKACTAVVTQVSHHPHTTISADVQFISEAQWREDLVVLFEACSGDDPSTQSGSGAASEGRARAKFNAVYPSIKLEDVARSSSVDDLLASRPDILGMLGSTQHVIAPDAATFKSQISKYIGGGVTNRPTRKPKRRTSSTADVRAMMLNSSSSLFAQPSMQSDTPTRDAEDISGGELWPLIEKVVIQCNAHVLSTGAVFVDLPGVMDDNVARNSIARDYLGKCDKIWIVAPIKRAVNDHLAKTLLNDHIRRQLKSKIMDQSYSSQSITFIATHTDDISSTEIASALRLDENKQYQELYDNLVDSQTSMDDLKDFNQMCTGSAAKLKDEELTLAMLRSRLAALDKLAAVGAGTKRQRMPDNAEATPPEHARKRVRIAAQNVASSATLNSDTYEDADRDTVITMIANSERTIKEQTDFLAGAALKVPPQRLLDVGQQLEAAQLAINTFCSLQRSTVSTSILQADFRCGLTEYGVVKPAKKGKKRAPTLGSMPVFCCSSRDYARLTGQVPDDGKPACFSDVDSTGVPRLRAWCLDIATAKRDQKASLFLAMVKDSAKDFLEFAKSLEGEAKPAHIDLKSRWESAKRDTMDVREDNAEQTYGISLTLHKEFAVIVDHCIDDMKARFTGALRDACVASADDAALRAVDIVKSIAGQCHWSTFRAALRRMGSWDHIDINEDMCDPLLEGMSNEWTETFADDLFENFRDDIVNTASELLHRLKYSAHADMRDEVAQQIKRSLSNLRQMLEGAINNAERKLQHTQRDITRSVPRHMQSCLAEGYRLAATGKGKGSTKQQKDTFNGFVERECKAIFDGTVEMIIERLVRCANVIGRRLQDEVQALAAKVEEDMAVLWAAVHENSRSQSRAHATIIAAITNVRDQAQFWFDASKMVRGGAPQRKRKQMTLAGGL
ncbi:hypothetical protein FA95DRAFT_1563346 [Auriscalpium vulgare]|uniref:Uncharacterized protein n=1 Tax=Auriscalpium vulgare TaxID=40419 RepID=A0ACB8RIL0_9AGAM|nr:hypothetical protein FA95DRAFT_1563346 [Auriscalpium vulgare]